MVGRKQELADEGFGSVALPNCVRPDGRFIHGDCRVPDRTYLGGGSFARRWLLSGISSGADDFAPEESPAEHDGWAIFHRHGCKKSRPTVVIEDRPALDACPRRRGDRMKSGSSDRR